MKYVILTISMGFFMVSTWAIAKLFIDVSAYEWCLSYLMITLSNACYNQILKYLNKVL